MTPNKQRVIDELNVFLKGRYMGIHQYERLIEHAKDSRLKSLLQDFQEQSKLEAQKVARRIQDLGGVPVDGVGMMGELREWMQRLKKQPDQIEEILRDAFIGERKYGVHFSHEMVAGDIDEESVKLIDNILENDQKRADQLQHYLESIQYS